MVNAAAIILGALIGAVGMYGLLVVFEKMFGTVIAAVLGGVLALSAVALLVAWAP